MRSQHQKINRVFANEFSQQRPDGCPGENRCLYLSLATGVFHQALHFTACKFPGSPQDFFGSFGEDVSTILEHAASGEIDLVLLDISLTNSQWEGRAINGVELCRMIKEKSPRRLPVLLATAHAMSGDRERFLETSGADGYLEKPVYDSAILVEKVRSLIEPA